MNSALAKIGHQIERHPAFTQVHGFFSWWRDQLVAGLPDQWKEKFSVDAEQVQVTREGNEWALIRNADGSELIRIEDEDSDLINASFSSALEQLGESEVELWYSFPASQCLRKELILPAAAEENLDQVLRFEMDKHTPFKADQVAFDWRVVERFAETKKIKLELIIANKSQIDELAQACNKKGLKLQGINLDDDVEDTGVNLLPRQFRVRKDRKQLFWNIGLGVLFVALLWGVLWLSVENRRKAVDAYRTQVDEIVAEAREVRQLRERIQNAEEAASFLTREKTGRPLLLDMMVDVTKLLPDDTWLQRFQFNNGKVQLAGQAPNTAALIGLLQQSQVLCNPSTRGAVTNDPKTGNERFTIEARLVALAEEGECDGAVASR